jgi:hypothetical protein
MMYLDENTLGQLDFTCVDGIITTNFEIGWPEVREVVDPRALSDGSVDTTRYLGSRAVTVSIRYNQNVLPTQDLVDMVTPYMSPRVRPTITWSIQDPPAGPNYKRSLSVRGSGAPLVIDQFKYHTMVLQWVSQDSYTSGPTESCAVATLTGTAESGRVYDLEFDRDYPASPPYGTTLFNTAGNAPMDWIGTLTAEVTTPEILVNDTTITFGALALLAGQTVIIDTQERTILRNGDPNDSLYGITNFQDWQWDDLRLVPGQNAIRLQAASSVGAPSFTLCWFDKWYS